MIPHGRNELEDVTTFKYLGATVKSGVLSNNELRIRLATATSAIIRLNVISTIKNIRFELKSNLYISIVISILFTHAKLER